MQPSVLRVVDGGYQCSTDTKPIVTLLQKIPCEFLFTAGLEREQCEIELERRNSLEYPLLSSVHEPKAHQTMHSY